MRAVYTYIKIHHSFYLVLSIVLLIAGLFGSSVALPYFHRELLSVVPALSRPSFGIALYFLVFFILQYANISYLIQSEKTDLHLFYWLSFTLFERFIYSFLCISILTITLLFSCGMFLPRSALLIPHVIFYVSSLFIIYCLRTTKKPVSHVTIPSVLSPSGAMTGGLRSHIRLAFIPLRCKISAASALIVYLLVFAGVVFTLIKPYFHHAIVFVIWSYFLSCLNEAFWKDESSSFFQYGLYRVSFVQYFFYHFVLNILFELVPLFLLCRIFYVIPPVYICVAVFFELYIQTINIYVNICFGARSVNARFYCLALFGIIMFVPIMNIMLLLFFIFRSAKMWGHHLGVHAND